MIWILATFYLLMSNNGVHEKKILIFTGTCQVLNFFYHLSNKDQHKICDKIWNIPIIKCCVAILTPN